MIAIIDYGMGNLRSVQKAFERVEANAVVTQDPKDIIRASKVVLPGVGAIKPAMEKLESLGMIEVINKVIKDGKPFLGICLGFQIICFAFNTILEKLDEPQNEVTTIEASDPNIFGNLLPLEAHKRHKWGVKELSDDLEGLAKSKYGWEIVKHKEKPIYGIQFHPEIITEETKGHLLFYKILKDISK